MVVIYVDMLVGLGKAIYLRCVDKETNSIEGRGKTVNDFGNLPH